MAVPNDKFLRPEDRVETPFASGQRPNDKYLPPEQAESTPLTAPSFDVASFWAGMEQNFPWIKDLGLGPAWFQEVAATSPTPDLVLAKLRQTDQYKQRFVGLYRPDGTLRMNESQYLQTESSYRQLLSQYGFDLGDYNRPQDLQAFFDSEIDPNELNDRLRTYRDIETGSQQVRDAFYVYAGLDVSVDDLYESVVNPEARQQLIRSYSERVASSSFDYETFVTRATELGMKRLAEDLNELSAAGAVTSEQVQSILRTQPAQAAQVIDALYTGGDGASGASFMSLQDLLDSFEYAALGSVASGAGLALPDRERIQQIRDAGVNRQQLIAGYQDYARRGGQLSAALQRVQGGMRLDQDTFEAGAFLGQGQAATRIGQAQAAEQAAGRSSGQFRFDQNRSGDLFQRGLNV